MIPYRPQPPRRSGAWGYLMPAVLLLLVTCIAGFGATWNRYRSPSLTMADAKKLLQFATDPCEVEQAIGALARSARDIVRVIADQEKAGQPAAKIHLDNLAQAIEEARR